MSFGKKLSQACAGTGIDPMLLHTDNSPIPFLIFTGLKSGEFGLDLRTLVYRYLYLYVVNIAVFWCRNVDVGDEGDYVCRASNEGGHSEQTAQLLIQSMSYFFIVVHFVIVCLFIIHAKKAGGTLLVDIGCSSNSPPLVITTQLAAAGHIGNMEGSPTTNINILSSLWSQPPECHGSELWPADTVAQHYGHH